MKINSKQLAFNDLKRRVLSLDMPPGSALDEVSLCDHYGLSRTPLREVLQRLAGEGYISLETNRGASVSSMDLVIMRNFFQIAPMIYSAVARLATEHATSPQINALKKTQISFSRAIKRDAAGEMAAQNHRFHEQLGEMADSPYLAPSLGRLLIDHARMSHRFYRIRNEVSRQRLTDSCDQHEAMIEAIEQGASELAVELTLKHWELSRREMGKYVSPDPLPIDEIGSLTLSS